MLGNTTKESGSRTLTVDCTSAVGSPLLNDDEDEDDMGSSIADCASPNRGAVQYVPDADCGISTIDTCCFARAE